MRYLLILLLMTACVSEERAQEVNPSTTNQKKSFGKRSMATDQDSSETCKKSEPGCQKK